MSINNDFAGLSLNTTQATFISRSEPTEDPLNSAAFMTEVEQLGSEIINQFPPSDYFYIGVGRSPYPILAWLEVKCRSAELVQIPLSNFWLCSSEDFIRNTPPSAFPSENSRELLFRHFEKTMPKVELIKKKVAHN